MAARSRSEKRLEAAYNESQGRSLVQRKHTILRLGRYMIQYKWLLLLAFIMTVGSNLLALVGPMLSGYAIDAIEPGMGKVEFSRVFHYAGWMAAFYVISSVLSYALSVLMITISRKVVYRMRKDVFDKMLALPAGYYDLHQTGDIISRISYDIDTVNESLSSDLIQILTTVITVGGALYMMVVISPRLVLVFAFTVPLSEMCIRDRFIAMPSRKAADGEYRDIAHPINSNTRDMIQRVILDKYETTALEMPEEEAALA